MDRLIDYFHRNYYPDMNVEDVASAMTDPAIQESALSHIQQMHYPNLSIEEVAANVKPPVKRQPIIVTNPNDPRLRAYNDSNALYKANPIINESALRVYNAEKNASLNFDNTGTNPATRFFINEFAKENDRHGKLLSKYGINGFNVRSKILPSEKNPNYLPQKGGFPDGITKENISETQFKKPVQPYKLAPKDMIRTDGTLKGKGFLGNMPNAEKGKISSELSIGINVEGKPALIPTMIPTLNQEELNHLLNNKYNPQARTGIDEAISQKAINFAYERKAKGLPYFATKEEEGKFKIQPTAKTQYTSAKTEKPQYTSAKKTYQGREFMETTGLRPGLYNPEEVEAAKAAQMKTKRRAF